MRVSHLNPEQVAKLCRCSIATLYQMQRRDDFPRPKKRGLYDPTIVNAWIADREQGKPLPGTGKSPAPWVDARRKTDNTLNTTHTALAARCTEAQLYLWVRRGDFPSPVARGQWSAPEVQAWIADRKAGKPLGGLTATIPRNWLPELVDPTHTYRITDLPTLTRYSTMGIAKLVQRGDFPPPIAGSRGAYRKKDVDSWIKDRTQGKPLPTSQKISPNWYDPERDFKPIRQPSVEIRNILADSYWVNHPEVRPLHTDSLKWREAFTSYILAYDAIAVAEYDDTMRRNNTPSAQIGHSVQHIMAAQRKSPSSDDNADDFTVDSDEPLDPNNPDDIANYASDDDSDSNTPDPFGLDEI